MITQKDLGNWWASYIDRRALTTDYLSGIQGSQSQTVLFKPLSGILNQRKYLPIQFIPITIELSLIDNMTDPIMPTTTLSDFSVDNQSLTLGSSQCSG